MATPGPTEGDDVALPPLPRINLPAVAKLRATIASDAFEFFGVKMQGDALLRFARYVGAKAKAPFDPAYETCRGAVGGEDLNQEALTNLAWRVAGNLDSLRAGRPVLPWSPGRDLVWAPIEVQAVLPAINKRGVIVADCDVVGLSGPLAAVRFVKRWTKPEYGFFSSHFGYTPPWKKPPMPFRHRDELVGMRFFGLIDPERSSPGRPGFRHIRVATSMLEHNRRLIRVRARVDPCPRGYTHLCHFCTVGRDSCAAATHPFPYFQAECTGCGAPDAAFDPAFSETLCVACDTRRRTTKQE